ncbi:MULTISPECIES: LysE family translocator [Providencia]|uniref:LysE family transporter n=1 Tax=Providencia heimbachae ATCC 35613 TaxID=1354272 RepID=A0A1B7JSE6_9GAMM|nr:MULTISPECIES: LysE family translocator [Providencia]MBP6121530.1 LysE family translocator [Providencia sp.]MDD9339817.1 LysE family translocator [Providencia heimbachae]NIH21067.1 LysE family translocator [Providencia heimbachae]OAT50836.1 LysE family transporter [Providencia heimbachae ATCC 35613]QCJ68686.1 LysE family translocator [Providencia heimbachae]
MTLGLIFSLFTFLFIAAVTPGPNNMLLTSSAANYGFRRSIGLLLGIMLGMQSILYLSAFGIAALLLLYPAIHIVLKVIGSGYLLWLAWKTATANYAPLKTNSEAVKRVTWYQGGLLQFLNPKAWMMGLGAVGSFSLPGALFTESIIVMSIAFIIVNLIAGLIWMGFGSLISLFLRSRQAWFIFNLVMGLLTAACVPLIWLE